MIVSRPALQVLIVRFDLSCGVAALHRRLLSRDAPCASVDFASRRSFKSCFPWPRYASANKRHRRGIGDDAAAVNLNKSVSIYRSTTGAAFFETFPLMTKELLKSDFDDRDRTEVADPRSRPSGSLMLVSPSLSVTYQSPLS